jgi:hypothetical protein
MDWIDGKMPHINAMMMGFVGKFSTIEGMS